MGRSSGSSCFKIIACGSGDSVDRDDLDASEKGADKHGWSFRKRSARHRVLSNTVITETPSSGNKRNPELSAVSFQAPADSTISDKTSETLWTEEAPRLSISAPKAATVSTLVKETASRDNTLVTKAAIEDDTSVTKAAIEDDTLVSQSATVDDTLVTQTATKDDTLVTKAATEDDTLPTQAATEDDTLVTEAVNGNDTSIDVNSDESAIVIQTAVRKFLAQRALVKHRKVVKLQAAVRGHLVRTHAVGTLRCVQAIVKMQALVRARHARLTETKNSGTKQHPTYISIEKLLNNSFACQLLESTPRTKQINLKLDPSKSDSAWKWLERWLSASATENEQAHKSESDTEFEEQDKANHPEDQVEYVIPSQDKPTAVKSDVEEEAVSCESKENFITHEETSSLLSQSVEPPQHVNTFKFSSEGTDLVRSETKHSDDIDQVEFNSLSDKPVLETDEPKRSMKRLAPEEADSDGRKFVFGSRKASNPAFIAAQSKFAELTSTSSSSKSFNSSNLDLGVDSVDTFSSSNDNAMKTREVVDLSENSVSHNNSKVHVGGSESGTELSISSTLDSPDRSEIENVEFEKESKVIEEQISNPTDNLDTEEKLEQNILGTELTHSISEPIDPKPEQNSIGADDEPSKPVNNRDLSQVEYKVEDSALVASIDPKPEPVHQVYKSSPEASPTRSHMTVPESQGTPASQVSTNTKKSRSDKKGSSQKRKSLSASKRSPINTGLDSGLRSSMEQLPKDHKTAKRRNSFGSPRPDHADQEPRDSSSSNSLPSYMQATESARAKALAASASPRSSPDVLDKETYIKKRHSLPGANGRQGSPRIQRSMSQAQQTTKGNSTNERKWQR